MIDDQNIKRVEDLLRLVNMWNAVKSLPKGIITRVMSQSSLSSNEIQLSGGQIQRIGIARALYNNPKILILDEATSALDNITEKAVMEAVNNLSKSITIIIIAHRLSTVKKCDNIYLFEKGELKDQGSYEKLIQNNKLLLSEPS